MKKLILISTILTAIFTKTKAQQWLLSPEAGQTLNFPALSLHNHIDAQHFLGAHFGVGISKNIRQDISVSTGLFYNSHHTTFKYDIPNNLIAYNIVRINYLRVPIHLNYNYKIRKGNLSLNAGPYFGFGVGGHHDNLTRNAANDDIVDRNKKSIDWGKKKPQTNIIEYGLNLGIKYAWKNGLFLKGQYARGIPSFQIYNLPHSRHQFITLGFGYDISFTQKSKTN